MTFESTQEVIWKMIEQRAIAICRTLKENRAVAHNRWKRHWRTRLSHILRTMANKMELPEPPKPE